VKLEAFHNDPKIKEKYLKRVKAHAAANEIIKGEYWENGKGCAVGCTIHGSQHSKYETELGIPEWLARVEDTIFEGLPNKRAKLWPAEFLSAITPGIDLEKIKVPFLIIVLENCLKSMDACVYDTEKFPDVTDAINKSKEAIELMIVARRSGNKTQLSAAESAAWSAAESAGSAAWSAESAGSAESAAWSARSAESAGSAARSAGSATGSAWSAESAAWSVRSAAWSARSTAWSARSEESAAWSAAYEYFADQLLELLRDCK
jgi:hypothetical protein